MKAKFKFFGESSFALPNKVAKSFDKNCKLKGFNVWVKVITTRAEFFFPLSEKEMEPGAIVLEKDADVSGRYFVAVRGVGDFPFSSLKKNDLDEVNAGKATCSFSDVSFEGELGLDAEFDADSQSINVGAHDQPLAKPDCVTKVIPKLHLSGASNFTLSKKLQKSFDKDCKSKGISVWVNIDTEHDSHSFPLCDGDMLSGGITLQKDTNIAGRFGIAIEGILNVPNGTLGTVDLDDINAGKANCTFRAVAYGDARMLDADFDSENESIAVKWTPFPEQ